MIPKKSLTYGIDFVSRTVDQEKQLIDKYKDYIDLIYINPPFEPSQGSYITRDYIKSYVKSNSDIVLDNTLKIVDFAREKGVKVNFTINGKTDISQLDKTLEFLQNIQPDSLTILEDYADFYTKHLPNAKLVWSFCSGHPTQTNFKNDNFDTFVLRSPQFWNKNLRPKDKESVFILNRACPNACVGCLSNTKGLSGCASTELVKKECVDLEKYLAYHSIIGKDISLYFKYNPDEQVKFKLGTRSEGTRFAPLDEYIDFIINEKDLKDKWVLPKSGEGVKFAIYQLGFICRLGRFFDYLRECPELIYNFDFDKFNDEKLKLWQNVNNQISEY